jgi:hypothetical protein
MLVGKTLKSKINGERFFVEELFTDKTSNREYYIVRHIASGTATPQGKEWFEKGLMQNLEIVN